MTLFQKSKSPGVGQFIYATGNVQSGNLESRLIDIGYNIVKYTLYEAIATQTLTQTLQNLFRNRDITLAIFFSPRTADIFLNLVKKYNLYDYYSSLTLGCLSKTIANKFSSHPCKKIITSQYPDTDSLVSSLPLGIASHEIKN
jgi:uroporphyrinogen-III synthase